MGRGKKNSSEFFRKLKVVDLKACNAKIRDANIEDLTVTNINGQPVTSGCTKIFDNINSDLVICGITGACLVNPGPFTQQLWDGLVAQVLDQKTALAERLQCGRLQERYIQRFFDCAVCPPDELSNCFSLCGSFIGGTSDILSTTLTIFSTNFGSLNVGDVIAGVGVVKNTTILSVGPNNTYVLDTPNKLPNNTLITVVYGATVCGCPQEGSTGTCPSVPLSIYGIQTVLPVRTYTCGTTGSTGSTGSGIQLISSISYNLDVINVTGTLAVRTVTAMVQVGWVDENGIFNHQLIDFGNRQFGATLDTQYGEKYTGTVSLPTALINKISVFGNAAAIQLIIFAEEGVEIDVGQPETTKFKFRQDVPVDGAVDTSFVAPNAGNGAGTQGPAGPPGPPGPPGPSIGPPQSPLTTSGLFTQSVEVAAGGNSALFNIVTAPNYSYQMTVWLLVQTIGDPFNVQAFKWEFVFQATSVESGAVRYNFGPQLSYQSASNYNVAFVPNTPTGTIVIQKTTSSTFPSRWTLTYLVTVVNGNV